MSFPAPEISVIMGVNRDDGSLRITIDSILEQKFTDFEFIILNDGSDTNVSQVIEGYSDDRIIHVLLEKVGLTNALNIGIERARGTFIARQDAGDFSLQHRLEKQIEYMKTHQSLTLLGTGVRESTVDGEALGDVTFPENSEEIKKHLSFQNTFCHGTVMYLKKHIVEQGLYNNRFVKAQDYDLWLRLSEKYELQNLPDILYNRVIDIDSISIKTKYLQGEYARLARESAISRSKGQKEPIIEVEATLSDEENVVNENQVKGNYYLHCGRILLSNRKKKKARRFFLRSISAWPVNIFAYIFLTSTFIPLFLIDRIEGLWKDFQVKKGIQI